jgi:HlyD family secretion protein
MTDRAAFRSHLSIRNHLLAAALLFAALVAGLGGWAATASLSGALIAQGKLVVVSNVKKVQHPTGGVIGELLVHEGDHVKAGEVVVRLDSTLPKANLAIVNGAMDELMCRRARLIAERDELDNIEFPDEIASRRSEHSVERLIASENTLFNLRRGARLGQKAQLSERMQQFEQEVDGLTKQIAAKNSELELVEYELNGVKELWRKNLIQIQRVTALRREQARLQGEMGVLTAETAKTRGRIAEIKLQIIQVDQILRSEVAKELNELNAKLSEVVERKVAAEDLLSRIEIRAPQSGTVDQLAVHTVGGVVAAGDPIMLIVPDGDDLAVEARVNPQDIDQIAVGQRAVLRFSAFNQRSTPEINGVVRWVSADTSLDQRSGLSFYTVRISLPPDEVERLEDKRLLPGMPVEAFLLTGDRTMVSYLTKPLLDQVSRAFRER